VSATDVAQFRAFHNSLQQQSFCAKSDVESDDMSPIPAKVLNVAKQSSQYRVLVQIELENI
jgi:hypothetical protein